MFPAAMPASRDTVDGSPGFGVMLNAEVSPDAYTHVRRSWRTLPSGSSGRYGQVTATAHNRSPERSPLGLAPAESTTAPLRSPVRPESIQECPQGATRILCVSSGVSCVGRKMRVTTQPDRHVAKRPPCQHCGGKLHLIAILDGSGRTLVSRPLPHAGLADHARNYLDSG